MNDYWATKKVTESINSASEFEKEMWILRNSMVWPACELNMSDISSSCPFSSLDKVEGGVLYIYKAKIKCRHTKKEKNKGNSSQMLKQKFQAVCCNVAIPMVSEVTTFFIFNFH